MYILRNNCLQWNVVLEGGNQKNVSLRSASAWIISQKSEGWCLLRLEMQSVPAVTCTSLLKYGWIWCSCENTMTAFAISSASRHSIQLEHLHSDLYCIFLDNFAYRSVLCWQKPIYDPPPLKAESGVCVSFESFILHLHIKSMLKWSIVWLP